MKTLTRTLKAVFLLLIGFALCERQANAQAKTLKEEITAIAKEIQKTLEDEKQDSIAIGDFTGPASMETNFGPAIQKVLMEELAAMKININKKATLSIKGDYFRGDDPKNADQKVVVNLNFRVHAANGKVKAEFSAEIKNNIEIAKMLGVTIALPKKGDDEVRNEEIKKRLDNPKVHIDGTKIMTSKDGEFAVEMLVKSNAAGPAAPRKAKDEEGQAFVGINRNELYEIKIYNLSRFEGAAAINIDGLDVFAFSQVKDPKNGLPKYSHFIIPAGQTLTVYGWHKTNDVADSFLVTEYGKGASSQAQIASGKVGVITLTFRSSGLVPDDLPQDDGSKDAKNNETGFGPPIKTDLQEVARKTGKVREIITVRYSR
ncbi:MAG: hypothetical protein K8T89_13960 [Planctomycetes bacterium]|nr:hypothetical protein [Planctomycetota bacterium]